MERIYIIDDEKFYVDSLCMAISSIEFLEIVGSSCFIDIALTEIPHLNITILMTDIRMPYRADGLTFIKNVKQISPKINVVAYTHEIYPSLLNDMKSGNWQGLIHKRDISAETIILACDSVKKGKIYRSEIISEYLEKMQTQKIIFSTTEIEIFPHLYKGLSNKQINELVPSIDFEGVKSRVANILSKCNQFPNVTEKIDRKKLPKFLLDNNLLDPE